jgi:hypothetical protein
MPRFVVERTFPELFPIAPGGEGARQCVELMEHHAAVDVTWVHSYVSDDRRRTYCICDGPTPEAIRLAAARSGFPVDRITEVRVLDPYFYG